MKFELKSPVQIQAMGDNNLDTCKVCTLLVSVCLHGQTPTLTNGSKRWFRRAGSVSLPPVVQCSLIITMESQNIWSWKGSMRFIKCSSRPRTGHPNNPQNHQSHPVPESTEVFVGYPIQSLRWFGKEVIFFEKVIAKPISD